MQQSRDVFPMLNRAVEARLFPGCSIAVWHRNETTFVNHGRLTYNGSSPQVTSNTYYDLASLTKPLVTSLSVLYLCSTNQIQLEWPIKKVLGRRSGNLADIPLKYLLCHSSGLAAHLNLYEILADIEPAQRKDACLKLISSLALNAPVPTYSDLGFILLGILLEELTETPLNVFFEERICPELETDQLFFLPIKGKRNETAPHRNTAFAPTGYCPVRKTMVTAQVNDLNAWWLGGVAGHAGIFGNTHGLLKALVQLMGIHNGRIDSKRIPRTWLKTFFTPVSGSHTRALGFDTPSMHSASGRYFSRHTVGHLGWTGVSFWMDLKQEVIIIFLCNRPFPRADNTQNLDAMREFRPAIHDLLWELFIK
ncbi:MAG: serine hydrolase [Dissulfuribacterales bacterium]